MASRTVYRCRQDMVCSVGGARTHFSEGDLVFEDHAVKPKGNQNFEEISEFVERTSKPYRRGVTVEDATAAPGEKRRVGRPRGAKNKPADEPAPEVQEEATDVEA